MNKNNADVGGWSLTILFLIFFPPVGIFLLFRQLMGYNKKSGQRQDRNAQMGGTGQYNQQYEYHYAGDPQKQQKQQGGRNAAQVNLKNGKKLTIAGGIVACIFGLATVTELVDIITWGGWSYALPGLVPLFGFMAAGLVMLYAGMSRTKKGKRFSKYLNLIGRRESISVKTLADTMGLSEKKVCDDLDEMLDLRLLPVGYLDRANQMLVLTDEGVKEPPKQEPKQEPVQKENDILREIQEVNDAIPGLEMSAKIDRIREITEKILDYQKKNPGKDAELRSFLDYYLPTTLKILRAYAQLDAQGIQGENITSAKARIEGMMDKVVEGFEKQLDKLFQADSLDIASDVQVLEQMLQKDGLSGGEGINLGL